ncbi:MAG TPA: Ig-like domain-containing protein [Trichocoleus sp.]
MITVRAFTFDGGTDQKKVTVTVALQPPDQTAPILTVLSPANNTELSGTQQGVTVAIKGQASDASGIKSVQFFVDGSSIASGSAQPQAPNNWSNWSGSVLLKTAGIHQIKVRATHPSTTLQFSDEVYLYDQVLELRHKAHEAFGGDEYPRLPVIVCPFRQSLVSGEIATGMAVKNRPEAPSKWLPFVLINSQIKSLDSVTLLHEIGHAAGLGHEGEVKKEHAVINFMQYFDPKSTSLPGRDGLSPHQVKTLANAYFAAPK